MGEVVAVIAQAHQVPAVDGYDLAATVFQPGHASAMWGGAAQPDREAAMTECLADPRTNDPNVRHERLFQRWARGGVGLMVTVNVMVDRRYHPRASDWFAATNGLTR